MAKTKQSSVNIAELKKQAAITIQKIQKEWHDDPNPAILWWDNHAKYFGKVVSCTEASNEQFCYFGYEYENHVRIEFIGYIDYELKTPAWSWSWQVYKYY